MAYCRTATSTIFIDAITIVKEAARPQMSY